MMSLMFSMIRMVFHPLFLGDEILILDKSLFLLSSLIGEILWKFLVHIYELGQDLNNLGLELVRTYRTATHYLSPTGLKEATYYRVEINTIDDDGKCSPSKTTVPLTLTKGDPSPILLCDNFHCHIPKALREYIPEVKDEEACLQLAEGCYDKSAQVGFKPKTLHYF